MKMESAISCTNSTEQGALVVLVDAIVFRVLRFTNCYSWYDTEQICYFYL